MNTVNIKINGFEYNLVGNEKEEYLHKVALYVDKKIKFLMDKNNKLSTTEASILTSLNIADEFFKNGEMQDEYKEKIEKLMASEKALNEQVEALESKVKQLEEHNSELLDRVNNNKSEEYIKSKDEEILKLNKELKIMYETSEKHLQDKNVLTKENKELRFQLQTAKYKVMDIQNRLLENQFDLAKAKKSKNNSAPLLNIELNK